MCVAREQQFSSKLASKSESEVVSSIWFPQMQRVYVDLKSYHP
jgi:hypothetical protein